jgi:LPS-assembly protein
MRPSLGVFLGFIPLALALGSLTAAAQVYRPPILGPSPQAAPPPAAGPAPVIERKDPPPPGIVVVRGIVKTREGEKYHLREQSALETLEYLLEADEIDYDRETGIAEARGAVHFIRYQSGEQLWAKRVDFNLNDKTGTFYEVRGSAYGKIDPRPGILTTGNPFLFQGDWAEKLEDRYILHQGVLTNCEMPSAWWTLRAPTIDIIPNDRALAYKSLLRLKGVPLLYAPVFYKDLSSNARKSGFLTPNFGNSNRRGLMFGLGYFWAINRSYDITYRPQYFTQRGLANTVDFRGKPTANSDFNAFVYGVSDKGLLQDDGTRIKQGGYLISVAGKALLPKGFYARGTFNYLSNFEFRQAFTESFNEAVFSEVNSVALVAKDWSTFHFNTVFTRQENFQSIAKGDTILIRKLPQVEFDSRDRQLWSGPLPVWVSWETSAGLVRRTQPLFQTRQFVHRLDAQPRMMTALHWKGVHLVPALSIRNTYYGSSFRTAAERTTGKEVTGEDLNRLTHDFSVDLILPTLERVYDAPRWMGSKMKHSVEARASYHNVGGVKDFYRIIRFDEMDLLTNTNEIEYSLTNRLWAKSRSGVVRDVLNWEIRQRRFFDPTFGGALMPGQRNVFLSSTELTAYTFLDQARNYSPIVSSLRAQPLPSFGLEWRQDYDPLRGKITNTSLSADARLDQYFFSVGHNRVSCVGLAPFDPAQRDQFCANATSGTVLSPPSNQLRGMVGIGQENHRGWNAGFLAIYDYTTRIMQYANTQLTYNTSCCAFSGQYRRFAFGTRNENQFRLAFVIANIGSFGTLRRQERLF